LGNPGIFRIKIRNKNVDLTPFDIAIYLPTTGVDAYPCNRLFIILGYFWTTWKCCATSVFSNL